MKSDLSKVNVGDWIWTIKLDWAEVVDIDHNEEYPICVKTKRGRIASYMLDGRLDACDMYPSAFIKPLEGFDAKPKPCVFKKGDKVLVSIGRNHPWLKRYFSHIGGIEGKYCCFVGGKDEWTSNGKTDAWDYCKKWEGEE